MGVQLYSCFIQYHGTFSTYYSIVQKTATKLSQDADAFNYGETLSKSLTLCCLIRLSTGNKRIPRPKYEQCIPNNIKVGFSLKMFKHKQRPHVFFMQLLRRLMQHIIIPKMIVGRERVGCTANVNVSAAVIDRQESRLLTKKLISMANHYVIF